MNHLELFENFNNKKYWKIRAFSVNFLNRVFKELGFPTTNYWYDFAINLAINDNYTPKYFYLCYGDDNWSVVFEFEDWKLATDYKDYKYMGKIEPTDFEIKTNKFNL